MEFFKKEKRENEGEKRLLRATTSTNVNALKASYLVTHRTAKADKAFSIEKELIPPVSMDIYSEILGEIAAKKIAQVRRSASVQFSSVQFSFISAPPHNKNATIL